MGFALFAPDLTAGFPFFAAGFVPDEPFGLELRFICPLLPPDRPAELFLFVVFFFVFIAHYQFVIL
jgi:hypothetical protein